MKVIRILGAGVLALVALAIAVLYALGAMARSADSDYHKSLSRGMTVTSPAIDAAGEIANAYTCKGAGEPIPVVWGNAPAASKSFALVMTDWDVPAPFFAVSSFTHWVSYDIPAEASGLPGKPPIAFHAGQNSLGSTGYAPPCPPAGRHRYTIRVYALDFATVPSGPTQAPALLDAMKGHVLAYGEVTGRFGD